MLGKKLICSKYKCRKNVEMYMSLKFFCFNCNRRLLELQYDQVVPGVRSGHRTQFMAVRIGLWSVPSQLTKCYTAENGKSNT